jgi:hypothetical protein
MTLLATGTIAVLAAGVTGCSGSGSSAAQPTAPGGQQTAHTAQQAVQLAASTADSVNSFEATISVQATADAGSGTGGTSAFHLAGTVTEQIHPSLLAKADYSTFTVAGQSLAEGMSEIITANAVYVKLSLLTQALHTSKPWLEVPFSSLKSGKGQSLSSLLRQLQTSNPLTQTKLLAGATDVKKVGTGTIDGVPVTEYTGSYSMTQALAKLPASLRASLSQDIEKAGFKSARFTVWVDGQHQVRKSIITEAGSSFTETVTTTVTSINQPVSIQVPSASQTTTLPASALSPGGQ